MGKKIIRLTESDLIRLVKRVIQEEDNMDNTNNHKLVGMCLSSEKMKEVFEWTKITYDGKYDFEMVGKLKKPTRGANLITVRSQKTPLKYSVNFYFEDTKGNPKNIQELGVDVLFKKEEIKDKKNFCEIVNTRILNNLN